MPEDVIVWQEDDSEPAPCCDPRTGMCTPAPANDDLSKEKESVDQS